MWQQTQKPKTIKTGWQLNNIQPINTEVDRFSRTTKHGEITPILTTKSSTNNQKLNTIITQADYASKTSTFQFARFGSNKSPEGPYLGPQRE